MRPNRFLLSFLLAISTVLFSAAQIQPQTANRDPQAVALLSKTLASIGRVPADSSIQGTVETVLGNQQESGTFQVLTRGGHEVLEQIKTDRRNSTVVISPSAQKQRKGQKIQGISFEYALTSEPTVLPFADLQSALTPDYSVRYIGSDKVNGIDAYHLRLRNTFTSHPKLKPMSAYTERDLWLDASSGLPLKLSWVQRFAGGSAPRLLIELFFSDYRPVSGLNYPFFVMKAVNGVPQSTFKVTSASFDNGLSDSDFSIQ